MYDMGDKWLSRIKGMYVDSSVCISVKGGESEQLKIKNGVRQGCIMSPWLLNVYMVGVMKEVGMGRRGVIFMEDGRECRLPGLLYTDDLVLCGALGKDLRMIVVRCVGEED